MGKYVIKRFCCALSWANLRIKRMRGAVHYISSTFCQSSYFAIDQSLLFTWKILIYFQVNILFVTFEYCAVYVRGINNAVLVFYMIVLNGTTG